MSKKNIGIIVVISISLVTLYFISFSDISTNAKEDTLMDEFENLKGESIVIEEDEFDFYSQIVRKKINDHSDEEKVKKETKKYIQDVYTQYLIDRKSTRLNSSHVAISYAVFCLKKK